MFLGLKAWVPLVKLGFCRRHLSARTRLYVISSLTRGLRLCTTAETFCHTHTHEWWWGEGAFAYRWEGQVELPGQRSVFISKCHSTSHRKRLGVVGLVRTTNCLSLSHPGPGYIKQSRACLPFFVLPDFLSLYIPCEEWGGEKGYLTRPRRKGILLLAHFTWPSPSHTHSSGRSPAYSYVHTCTHW